MQAPGRHLCRGYSKARKAAPISYAALRIFGSNRSCCELTVKIQDGSFDDERRQAASMATGFRVSRCISARSGTF